MVLEKLFKNKRSFNINNKNDIECYRKFVRENRWGPNGCPFILEYPHVSIPDMIKEKLIRKYLKV
jgi:hypothetical protein